MTFGRHVPIISNKVRILGHKSFGFGSIMFCIFFIDGIRLR